MNKARLLILEGKCEGCKNEKKKVEQKALCLSFCLSFTKSMSKRAKKKENQLPGTPEYYSLHHPFAPSKKSLNYSANLSLAVARLVLKKTIKASGLILDSRLIFNLHLCYFLMSCSFLHCHIVPYLTASFLQLPGL